MIRHSAINKVLKLISSLAIRWQLSDVGEIREKGGSLDALLALDCYHPIDAWTSLSKDEREALFSASDNQIGQIHWLRQELLKATVWQ